MIKYENNALINSSFPEKKPVIICGFWRNDGDGDTPVGIYEKWPAAFESFKEWRASLKKSRLGRVQFVSVDNDLYVASAIVRAGEILRHAAVALAFEKIVKKAVEYGSMVYLQNGIFSGIERENVEMIIKKVLEDTVNSNGVNVEVLVFEQ
jgi:hypothetical protein